MRVILSIVMVAIVATLIFGLHDSQVSAQQSVDYDADDDGLIEISTIEQLNALRWDLDGDGAVDAELNADDYSDAFPNAESDLGCATSGCTGYELSGDLDFRTTSSYASNRIAAAYTTGAGWQPIGSHTFPYSGTLDGNGFAINNLHIDRPSSSYLGVFGEASGQLLRIGVIDVNVRGADDTGALVGANSGTVSDSWSSGEIFSTRGAGGLVGKNDGGGLVTDSYSSATVEVDQVGGGLIGSNYGNVSDSYSNGLTTGNRLIGGLIGLGSSGRVTTSYSTGSTSGREVVGGLVGLSIVEIIDSYSTGPVNGTADDVGGIVGVAYRPITRSYSTGNVAGVNRVGGIAGRTVASSSVDSSWATGDVSANTSSGGIVGWNDGNVMNSYASGDVVGADDDHGGIVGRNNGTVRDSYAQGRVSGFHRIGGLVGYNTARGIVDSTYATGAVSGNFETGGLVGWNNGEIETSYATGTVRATRDAGGLAGESTGNISASYWDVQVSGMSVGVGFGDQDGALGLTTSALKSQTRFQGIYADWSDGDDYWDLGTASEYPVLTADLNGDGVRSWEEFGEQGRSGQRSREYLSRIVDALVIVDPAARDSALDAVCANAVATISGQTSRGMDEDATRDAVLILWICTR